jgi:hypothetical protein
MASMLSRFLFLLSVATDHRSQALLSAVPIGYIWLDNVRFTVIFS